MMRSVIEVSACLLGATVLLAASGVPATPSTDAPLPARRPSIHLAAAPPMPTGHFIVGSRQYDYDIASVSSETAQQIFLAPQSIAADTRGVHLVDKNGLRFDFPVGSVVRHSVGHQWVRPGDRVPAWLQHARYVRTIERSDGS